MVELRSAKTIVVGSSPAIRSALPGGDTEETKLDFVFIRSFRRQGGYN